MKLNFIFSVKTFIENIKNKWEFRYIVFLGSENNCSYELKKELSRCVNITAERNCVYSEKTAAVILFVSEDFDIENYEICIDSKKKCYIIFDRLADFLNFNFKGQDTVCLIPAALNLKKEELISTVSKLLGYLNYVEEAEFKSMFFDTPKTYEIMTLKQKISDAVNIVCSGKITNPKIADLIFVSAQIKNMILNKKTSLGEIALKNYINENRLPYSPEFLVVMQMLIFKMNREFLMSGEFNNLTAVDFYKRLRMFWANNGKGSPNFEFAMDNDICKLKLSKIYRRLYLMEEELFNICYRVFELIKENPETKLFIDVLNEEKVLNAIKYSPEHNEFCMLSILRNFGYLEVI